MAGSSVRIFLGCWLGHDRPSEWEIWRLAVALGSFQTAGWITILVANGRFGGWNSARTISDCWLGHDLRGSVEIWRLAVASGSLLAGWTTIVGVNERCGEWQ